MLPRVLPAFQLAAAARARLLGGGRPAWPPTGGRRPAQEIQLREIPDTTSTLATDSLNFKMHYR